MRNVVLDLEKSFYSLGISEEAKIYESLEKIKIIQYLINIL